MAEEARYEQSVLREYEGEGIVVGWEPALCIHVANCIRALPWTFVPEDRPWVHTETSTADEIAEAIRSCPTGALTYRRTDGSPPEEPEDPTTVQPRTAGPLFVRGRLRVVDSSGEVVREATRLALCRCGHSENKPYCDLSHRRVGFRG